MPICFHPSLFDTDRFERLPYENLYERMAEAWITKSLYGWEIDGNDITSGQILTDECSVDYRSGSMIDNLIDRLSVES